MLYPLSYGGIGVTKDNHIPKPTACALGHCAFARKDKNVTDTAHLADNPTPAVPDNEELAMNEEQILASVSPTMLDAVLDLRHDVAAAGLPLAIGGVESARVSRERLLDQLDNHLIPRLQELTAPALVVLAGPTGSGKSTVVNSIACAQVSPAGVLRPTTRQPVLVHHPADVDVLAKHPLLVSVEVKASEHIPRGIILVDAPDMDSISADNRKMSHRLLEAADLWLFLTTAHRYGDAIPWQHLYNAKERGASVALILNRVGVNEAATVRTDLTGRLVAAGMADVPVFLVPDAGPKDGLLSGPPIEAIARWLALVAGPDRAKHVVQRTLRGSLAALAPWVDELGEAVQLQVDARDALRQLIRDAIGPSLEMAQEVVGQNALADGGAQARWAALAAPGGLLDVRHRRNKVKVARIRPAVREELQRTFGHEIDRAVQVGVQNVGLAAEAAIRGALLASGSLIGAGELLADVDKHDEDARRRKDARLIAGSWLQQVAEGVEASRASGTHCEQLCRALGTDTVATVVASAAIGLLVAQDFLQSFAGSVGVDLVTPARQRLIARLVEQVEREASVYTGIVDGAGLADDAAAGLGVRLAVLKEVV